MHLIKNKDFSIIKLKSRKVKVKNKIENKLFSLSLSQPKWHTYALG
ncbi:MAG: hypothetical protein PWP27_1628 [Clostridiales bacterium]|nr:hypothetical protein [Clostridiales bacterium]